MAIKPTFSLCGLLLLAATTGLPAWPGSAGAAERDGLIGYGQFTFGMAEAEVRRLVTVERESNSPATGPGDRLLVTTTQSHIGTTDYLLHLVVSGGTLKNIDLRSRTADDLDHCERRHREVEALMVEQYGLPKGGRIRLGSAETALLKHDVWPFKDGALVVKGSWIPKGQGRESHICDTGVVYIQKRS